MLAEQVIALSGGCDAAVAQNSVRIIAELAREEEKFASTLEAGVAEAPSPSNCSFYCHTNLDTLITLAIDILVPHSDVPPFTFLETFSSLRKVSQLPQLLLVLKQSLELWKRSHGIIGNVTSTLSVPFRIFTGLCVFGQARRS